MEKDMIRPGFGSTLWLVAVVAFLGLSGSGMAHVGFATSPAIVSFTVSSDTIRAGDSANLTWVTRGADLVTLEGSPETGPEECLHHLLELPVKGSLRVHPKQTTVYELSCKANFTEQLCAPMTVLVSVN